MAVSYGSGSIHFTGLGSETDFDGMITKLKQIESHQKNRFTLWQADWNKRIEAFQKLNTAMLSLNSSLNSMNTLNKFMLKTTMSSKEDIMTAVANGNAQNGTNKVQVGKLATNAAYTWQGSKFSSPQDKANATNQTQQFVYTYKGKTVKVAIGANATMQQLINQINSDANNPGVRASMVKDGLDYVFQFQGQDTGASATLTIDPSSSQLLAVRPPTEHTTFGTSNAVINSSGSSKNFIYTYDGANFTIPVNSGQTLEDLRDAINNDGANPGVTASVIQNASGQYALQIKPDNGTSSVGLSGASQIKINFTTNNAAQGTGWKSMDYQTSRTSSDLLFDKADRSVNSSGSNQDFKWTDSSGGTVHSVTIADGETLKDLVNKINSAPGTNTRAEICKNKDGKYYLQLTNTDPTSSYAPEVDSTSSSLLAITAENTTPNWKTELESYTLHSQGFSKPTDKVNYSSDTQQFKYSFDDKTYSVNVPQNATLEQLVAAINANSQDEGGGAANTLVKARVACDGENAYRLYLAPVDSNTDKEVTIAADSSSCLEIAPSRASWKTQNGAYTYQKTFDSGSQIINNSGATQQMKIIDGSGNLHSVSVTANMTLDQLVSAINSATPASFTASTVSENGKLKLALSDTNGGVSIDSTSSKLLEVAPGDTWSSSNSTKSISFGNFSGASEAAAGAAVINSSGGPQDFVYLYKDKQYKVSLAAGATLQNLVDAINANPDSTGLVRASIGGSPGNYQFVLAGDDADPRIPNIADGSSSALTISRTTTTSSIKKEKNSLYDFTATGTPPVVNNTGTTQKFTYTNGNTTGTIDVPAGCTLDQFVSMINNNKLVPGAYASVECKGSNQYTLRLSGNDPKNPPVVSPSSSRASGFLIQPPNSTFTEDNEVPVSVFGTPVNGTDVVNSSGATQKFLVEYQGKNISLNIENGETINDLIAKINNHPGGQIKAGLFTDTDGEQYFQLWGTDPADTRPPQVSTTSSSDLTIKPPDIGSGDWFIQLNSNAQVKLNDWPGPANEWIESETNAPTELIEGVTLNFKEVGTSQITVTTNDVGIKEQIVALVDALNSVRSLVNELTKVNADKNPEEIGEAASNFDAQYGSILTGNYGVQLLSSILKSNTASQAKGFQYQHKDAEGLLSGDLFTSLAHVGITTDAETNSPTFGLLKIDEAKLDASLKQDPEAVATLFAADNKASTDSSDFSFANYISGTTQPGVYQFNYEIDTNDNILDPYVMYEGKRYKASYDGSAGQITILEGPGTGLAITVNNTAQGTYTGTVTLKMGKVGELASLTKDMNSDTGILNILKKNYQQISKNIQDKIDREDERLIVWERNMRARFARLEAVLAQYNALNTQLESTIKTLPGGKS